MGVYTGLGAWDWVTNVGCWADARWFGDTGGLYVGEADKGMIGGKAGAGEELGPGGEAGSEEFLRFDGGFGDIRPVGEVARATCCGMDWPRPTVSCAESTTVGRVSLDGVLEIGGWPLSSRL